MPLITRIARLFHADINAVLDKIEEPELLLKQAIRDMQEALDRDQRHIKLQEYELKQLDSALTKKEATFAKSLVGTDSLEAQLKICFKSNKDDLARTLIKRKLETEHSIAALSHKKIEGKALLEQLNSTYKEQRTQLKKLQQKAEILSTTDVGATYQQSTTNTIQDDDIEIAFLHEKAKWSAS